MPPSDSKPTSDSVPELRFSHLRQALLDPLLATNHAESGAFPSEIFARKLAIEVLGHWLPIAVAADCYPYESVKSFLNEVPETGLLVPPFGIESPAGSPEADWDRRVLAFGLTLNDPIAVYEALNVLLTVSTDSVANEFVGRLLGRELPAAASHLREISRDASRATLIALAADLPAWMTDGPYRQRANLAHLGEQLNSRLYLTTKHNLWRQSVLSAGDSDSHLFRGPVGGSFSGHAFLSQLARAERHLVAEVLSFDDWAQSGMPRSRVRYAAGRAGSMELSLLADRTRWRMIPEGPALDDLLEYSKALRPLLYAVMPGVEALEKETAEIWRW